jgi:hypothetical protein
MLVVDGCDVARGLVEEQVDVGSGGGVKEPAIDGDEALLIWGGRDGAWHTINGDMTFADGVWTLDRKAIGPKDFDQRMKATFSADGNTITAESELRDSRTHEMRHDLSLAYRRS